MVFSLQNALQDLLCCPWLHHFMGTEWSYGMSYARTIPCTGGLHPSDPVQCESCEVAIATPLSRESLIRMDPEIVVLQFCWEFLVRFHTLYRSEGRWMDPQILMVLGIDRPAPATSVSILQALLQSSRVQGEDRDVLTDHLYVHPEDKDVMGPVDPPNPELPQAFSLSSPKGQPVKKQASP